MRKLWKRLCATVVAIASMLALMTPITVHAAATTIYKINSNYSGKTFKEGISDWSNKNLYNWGLRNYQLCDYSFSTNSGSKFIDGYLKAYTYQGDYFVYKIKSPGSGLRTLSLQYGAFKHGGTGSVYILETSTTDIAAALIPDNRVGSLSFYSSDASLTDVSYGHTTTLGTWNFGSAKEYYVVLECSAPAPIYPKQGYMYPGSLTITEGSVAPEVQATEARSVIITEEAIETFEMATYSATGMIGEEPHIFIPTEGKKLFIYNLITGEKYDEVDTRFTVCRGITLDPQGRVWMTGSQYYLQCYDPATRVLTEYKVPFDMESGYDLQYGNGCLYFGTSPTAFAIEFNIATETFRNLGNFNEDASYACGLPYDPDGFLYVGLTGNKNADSVHTREVVKIQLSDATCVGRTDVSDCVNKKEIMIRGASLVGDIYIAGGIEMDKMLAIDTNTMTQTQLTYKGTTITNPVSFGVSEALDGKHYMPLLASGYNGAAGSVPKGVYAIDAETYEVTLFRSGAAYAMKNGQNSIIEINGNNCLFYVTGGYNGYYNLTDGKLTSLKDLISNNEGAAVTLQSLALGAPGSNDIYIGAFNNNKCAVFNTATGEINRNFYTNGQTDTMLTYNGVLYSGNYKDGVLIQVDQANEKNNKVLLNFRTTLDPNGEPFNQVRIHALAAGDGKVFAGTMPDSYLRGGCIGWYDTVTGESYIERNVVQNQSINSLAYYDGYLYGTTTTSGGTGSGTDTSLSAKLFIYDVANKKKVAEIDLRDEIDGLPTRLNYVSGVVVDPDIATNGKLWGVVAETLFSFTFDKATATVNVKEELVISKTKYSGPGSTTIDILFQDGYIYAYFRGAVKFCKINYADPTQYSLLPVVSPSNYIIGEDKNLYFTNDDTLYMYPLTVTDADRAAATAVDTAIANITKPVTVENKTEIEETRAAYDSLTWTQRALMSKYTLLQEAEADLLEARIEQIDLSNPDRELVNELAQIYDAMPYSQKKYVTNYSILGEARKKLELKAYETEGQKFSSLAEALTVVPDNGEIKLLTAMEEGDVELQNGVTLDLNGNTLICDSFDCVAVSNGHLIDSSGGEGLLQAQDLLLREDNKHMPLWDESADGYRLFGYTFTVDSQYDKISSGVSRFWYRLAFDTESAYMLMRTGGTGGKMGAEIYWNGEHLVNAIFGRGEPINPDTFCIQWAEQMVTAPETTWLYVQISGLSDFEIEGTLTVKPVVIINGVRACVSEGAADSIDYMCKPIDYGYVDRG